MGDKFIGTILKWALLLGPAFTLACDPGWFGSLCQYKCHCENNSCDITYDGLCTGNTRCVPGWFGPSCQYGKAGFLYGSRFCGNADLAQYGNVTKGTVITDGDDTSCVTDTTLQSVTVSWNISYPFTWMRIVIKGGNIYDLLNDFKVEFISNSSQIVACTNSRLSVIENTTVDIVCDLNTTVEQVTLTGTGVGSLCSLYISGGRNVALKQNATQTSTYPYYGVWEAKNAVDGNTREGNTSCISTHDPDDTPIYNSQQSWRVTLSYPQPVNRYVIYNRGTQRMYNQLSTNGDASGDNGEISTDWSRYNIGNSDCMGWRWVGGDHGGLEGEEIIWLSKSGESVIFVSENKRSGNARGCSL